MMDDRRRILAEIEENMPENPILKGWNSYSQCDEDGIIRECLMRIKNGGNKLSNTFIEFGCGNGIENNTIQLILDGFAGCWIDGNHENISRIGNNLEGTIFPTLWILESFLDLNNIEQITKDCAAFLGTKEIDFCSLDVDGNDSHLLTHILLQVHPKLLCVEYNAKFHPPTVLEIKYNASHVWQGNDYFGASLQAFVNILEGYKLVCCNVSGSNAFFVDRKYSHLFKEYDIEDLYQPARYWLCGNKAGHTSSFNWVKQILMQRKNKAPWLVEVYAPNLGYFKIGIHRRYDPFVSGSMLISHTWEPFETEIFLKFCKPGDFVMDIGANIGWYSMIASKAVGEKGQVLSVEPNIDNYALLKNNLLLSEHASNSTAILAALSNVDRKGKLYLSNSNSGDHELFDDGNDRLWQEVDIKTLDSLFYDSKKTPTIVKSDTQGMEAMLFDGARRLFSNGWRPIWLLEFWPYGLKNSGANPMDFYDKLISLNYLLFEIDNVNLCLKKITEEYLKNRVATDLSPVSMNFIDILAIDKDSMPIFENEFMQSKETLQELQVFLPRNNSFFPPLSKGILFGINGNDSLYVRHGFSFPEADFRWTVGNVATIAFDLGKNNVKDIYLLCNIMPFCGKGLPKQRVKIIINGTEQAFWEISAPEEKCLLIPANLAQKGQVYIQFYLQDAISPEELGVNDDSRKLALAFKKIMRKEI